MGAQLPIPCTHNLIPAPPTMYITKILVQLNLAPPQDPPSMPLKYHLYLPPNSSPTL